MTATGTIPFLMDHGKAPLTPDLSVIAATNSAACPFIGKWREVVKMVKHRIKNAKNCYKQQFDKRITDMELSPGDQVLLSTKNLKPLLSKSLGSERRFKVSRCYLGAFPVLQRIGKVAYKLDLTSASFLKDVHPVSHS
jgi:hypothetical protein